MVELIHKEVTSQIIAATYEVGNQLGVGFLEKVYENAMKVELKLRGLKVETQQHIWYPRACDLGLSQSAFIRAIRG